MFYILSDHIPLQLSDDGPVEFSFLVGRVIGYGTLFYMLDGEGGRGYRVDLNGRQGPLFSPPPVRLYCSFCTTLGPPLQLLKDGRNKLQFTSVGAGPPLHILHVVLQCWEPGVG
jgi:hypothetical protein